MLNTITPATAANVRAAWLLTPPMDTTTALMLIAREAAGIDCTEDESAKIKGFFDHYRLDGDDVDPLAAQLAEAYPLETAEWWQDTEDGVR